jgi:hypothetical protein
MTKKQKKIRMPPGRRSLFLNSFWDERLGQLAFEILTADGRVNTDSAMALEEKQWRPTVTERRAPSRHVDKQ